jgi:uncharacterized protein YndB with AHSA1/START domain
MADAPKTIEVRVERTIPAPPSEVYDAWLNPKIPGNPWSEADKLLLDPRVDGFFYWLIHGTAHYGRFTKADRPNRLQHTWMSKNTHGEETTVTVTFEKKGNETLMTLVHSGLPDTDRGQAHEKGWNYYLGNFSDQYAGASRKQEA